MKIKKSFLQGWVIKTMLFVFALFLSDFLFAQSTITGTVSDNNDKPLSNVSVTIKGKTIGTSTNSDGTFSIPASVNDVIVFSSVETQTKEVRVRNTGPLKLQLETKVSQLNDVVVVGYGTQKKASITGSVASITTKEITINPTMNVLNGVTGRLPGLTAIQRSGSPGDDNPLLLIRGIGTSGDASPLIIMDGFPVSASDIARLDPQEVQSITILKDAASAAVYGNRGGNGVILVTTRRGRSGKPKVSYVGNVGYQVATRTPESVDGYTEALKYNEAVSNDGFQKYFSDVQLQQIKNGQAPYGNTNWFKELLQPSVQQSHTINLSGGSPYINYFIDYNYTNQNGYYKTSNAIKNSFRTNLDINATSTTKVSLDLSYRNTAASAPTTSIGDLYYTAFRAPSYWPVTYGNDKYTRIATGNPMALANLSGTNKQEYDNLFATFQIVQQLPVKGLSVKALLNLQRNKTDGTTWNTPYAVYIYDTISHQANPTEVSAKPSLRQSSGIYKSKTFEFHLNYDKTFGDHSINALVLYTQTRATLRGFWTSRGDFLSSQVDQLFAGSSSSQLNGNDNQYDEARQGVVGRLNYGYRSKYLAEFNFRYDGSQNFPANKRWGFFPSVSAGWVLSEEKFIKDNVRFIDFLKVRASKGQLGNDKVPQYQFVSAYYLGAGYPFGVDRQYSLGLYQGPVPNPDITWERVTKSNIGLEARMFKGLLGIEADYFFDHRTNILTPRSASVPSTFGAALPSENIGIINNKGYELVLTHYNKLGKNLNYSLRGNISFAKNEVIFIDEPSNIAAAIRKTGRPLYQYFGYIATGYFQSQQDIDASAKQGNVKPGDVKYADISGPDGNKPDGKVDSYDRTQIGKSKIPEITYGLQMNVKYKGVELNMFWQGAANYNVMLNSEISWAFFNGAQILKNQLDYWTPTNPNAQFPRLTTSGHANNNFGGDFNYGTTKWLYDASYLRLKNIELAYNFNNLHVLNNEFGLRLYVNAFNLLTFSKVAVLDPENPDSRGWSYPQQKIYNVGVKLDF